MTQLSLSSSHTLRQTAHTCVVLQPSLVSVSPQQQLHIPSLPHPYNAALQDGQDIKPSERIAAKQALPHLQLQLVAELQAEGVDPEAAGQVCLPGLLGAALNRSAKPRSTWVLIRMLSEGGGMTAPALES